MNPSDDNSLLLPQAKTLTRPLFVHRKQQFERYPFAVHIYRLAIHEINWFMLKSRFLLCECVYVSEQENMRETVIHIV